MPRTTWYSRKVYARPGKWNGKKVIVYMFQDNHDQAAVIGPRGQVLWAKEAGMRLDRRSSTIETTLPPYAVPHPTKTTANTTVGMPKGNYLARYPAATYKGQRFVLYKQIYPKIRYFQTTFVHPFAFTFYNVANAEYLYMIWKANQLGNMDLTRQAAPPSGTTSEIYGHLLWLGGGGANVGWTDHNASPQTPTFPYEPTLMEVAKHYKHFFVYETKWTYHIQPHPVYTTVGGGTPTHIPTAGTDPDPRVGTQDDRFPSFTVFSRSMDKDERASWVEAPVQLSANNNQNLLRSPHFRTKFIPGSEYKGAGAGPKVKWSSTHRPHSVDDQEAVEALVGSITIDKDPAASSVSITQPSTTTFEQFGILVTDTHNPEKGQIRFQLHISITKKIIFFERDEDDHAVMAGT